MLSRCSLVVAGCLCLSLWSQRSFAYQMATDISFSSDTWALSGYSETYKDPWEPDADYYCVGWGWDDIYGYTCTAVQTVVYVVGAKANLYTPSSTLHSSATAYDLRDARASYSVIVEENPNGVWTGGGDHEWNDDIYLSYCYYNFCTPPFYAGSVETGIGQSSDSTTVAVLAHRVRFQAQIGAQLRSVGKIESAQPISAIACYGTLSTVAAGVPGGEMADFASAFVKAQNWINACAIQGGCTSVDRHSWYSSTHGSYHVDTEVFAGIACN